MLELELESSDADDADEHDWKKAAFKFTYPAALSRVST